MVRWLALPMRLQVGVEEAGYGKVHHVSFIIAITETDHFELQSSLTFIFGPTPLGKKNHNPKTLIFGLPEWINIQGVKAQEPIDAVLIEKYLGRRNKQASVMYGGAHTSIIPEPSAGRALSQLSPREGSRVSRLCWLGRINKPHVRVLQERFYFTYLSPLGKKPRKQYHR